MPTKVWIKYCEFCKHLDAKVVEDSLFRIMRCTAFPDKIPSEISVGEVDHRLPYEGDKDIQFEFQEDTSKLPLELKNIDVEDAQRLLSYSFYYADFNQKEK